MSMERIDLEGMIKQDLTDSILFYSKGNEALILKKDIIAQDSDTMFDVVITIPLWLAIEKGLYQCKK